jgi:hypothetical protein
MLHGINAGFTKNSHYKHPWKLIIRVDQIKSMQPDQIIFEPVRADSDKSLITWKDYDLRKL